MKDYTLSQQFAIVGLDGLDSVNPSTAKYAVLRGLAVARFLDVLLASGTDQNQAEFLQKLESKVNEVQKLNRKELEKVETEPVRLLKADGVLEEIPSLLGSDMYYVTAGITIRDYRSQDVICRRIKEGLRAEILEEGEVTLDSLLLLWLLRECACIYDFFSLEEQQKVESRMFELGSGNGLYRGILALEFHRSLERLTKNFLELKKEIFKNPTMEGINLVFPFLERRQAVFIDMVVLGTTVTDRRLAALTYLSEKGHYVEEVKYGEETLIRIDNQYYRVFPWYRMSKLPIQGVNIVPVYK